MYKNKKLDINVFDGDDGIKYIRYEDMIKILDKIKKDNEERDKELEEYKELGIRHFKRPYAKRYLKERRKEIPNLLYPDSEEIYMDYYDLKDRIDKAIKKIYEMGKIENGDKINNFQPTYVFNNDELELLETLNGEDK